MPDKTHDHEAHGVVQVPVCAHAPLRPGSTCMVYGCAGPEATVAAVFEAAKWWHLCRIEERPSLEYVKACAALDDAMHPVVKESFNAG